MVKRAPHPDDLRETLDGSEWRFRQFRPDDQQVYDTTRHFRLLRDDKDTGVIVTVRGTSMWYVEGRYVQKSPSAALLASAIKLSRGRDAPKPYRGSQYLALLREMVTKAAD